MERDKKMVLGRGIVAFVMVILVFSPLGHLFLFESCLAEGTTIYVDDSNTAGPWDGTQDYPYKTIHEAVAAANDGETVFVASGTYNENVDITKDLTLTGENKDTTFVDGGGNDHVLNVYGPIDGEIHVRISGLTIRNAGGSSFACVSFSYVTDGEITDNKILNSQGGGISLDHCRMISISNNYIYNNAMAGISISLSEQNTIQNNIIQDNQKGIHVASFSNSNEISRNTISENIVYGVYIFQSSSNVLFLNNFTGNQQNAQDSSTNSWSSNGQGNYWSDYTGYDNNSDNIGDIPYNIPGGSNRDDYPLGYFKQIEPPGDENNLPTVLSVSINPTSATVGETITFHGEGSDSDGYIVGYLWRSNSGGTLSTEQSFSTSSLSTGLYTIYFKVQDNNGAWSTETTKILTISSAQNKVPTAVIDEITPNPAQQGTTVVFRGHGVDQDGTIISYKWLSNKDGVIGTASSFSISILSVGTHTIYFQVKDSAYDWSQQVIRLIVIEHNSSPGNPENQAPLADAGGPYQGKVNETTTFNGSRSHDEDGTIALYLWSFGDNSNGSGVSPTHMYTASGIYNVTLSITDNEGKTATAFSSVVISKSTSQGDDAGGFSGFAVKLLSPVNIVVFFLLGLGAISGFIIWMRRR